MIKKYFVFVISLGLLAGCSAFRSPNERISIMTNQPDAAIFVNGQRAGSGQVVMKVKRSRNVQIMATKSGYETSYYNIDSNLNITGVLDILGTFFFIVPVVGIFFPGAKSLEQTNVALHMEPLSPTN